MIKVIFSLKNIKLYCSCFLESETEFPNLLNNNPFSNKVLIIKSERKAFTDQYINVITEVNILKINNEFL